MKPLDWIIASMPLVFVLAVSWYAMRYMKSVTHFLSGGRVGGRYLLAVAGGELQAGAVVFVALFEVIGKAGLSTNWWGMIAGPVWLFLTVSGFVLYRYRQTRAMTLAQFFELRYSKSFRFFTGILGFISGVLNFGIIPAIGARFLVYFLGLPPELTLRGFTVPAYIPLMGLFITVAACITLSGGIISLMIANCIEGILSQLFYLIIIGALLMTFSWPQISQTLSNSPPGHSMINPFDSLATTDFNLWYVIMGLLLAVYARGSWQNASGYGAAALSAHEARMAGVLGSWREMGKNAVVILLGICAVTYLSHPAFSQASASAHSVIDAIANPRLQEQMRLPVAISYMLPEGVKGIFCAILLMGIFGGDATHLHSWGSILVQDVLLPWRKRPFTPRQHILLLRLSVTGVAIFAFLFGCMFRQTEYIIMWFTITTAIYVGGAGAAVIGGLYWSRGTTQGAWAGLLTGSLLSLAGILFKQAQGQGYGSSLIQFYTMNFGEIPGWLSPSSQIIQSFYFWVVAHNGMQISFGVTLLAIAAYVLVSLATCRKPFNMDRMLHRGAYAVKPSAEPIENASSSPQRKPSWFEKIAELNDNFSRQDKWITGGLVCWSLLWFSVFAIITIWNLLVARWPDSAWSSYWHVTAIAIPVVMATITGIWFTWGGIHDVRELSRRLKRQHVSNLDDGTVVGNQNLDEIAHKEKSDASS